MKHIYFALVCALAITIGHAQDYRLMTDTDYSLFDNGQDLRAIRVDSTTMDGTTLVQHLSTTIQELNSDEYGCFTPYGPSWMGPRIRISADGTQLLFNLYGDTIRMETHSGIDQPWIAYQSPDLFVRASVTSVIQSTVLSDVDSLKIIDFQALNAAMEEIDHSVNNLEISVSKDHGLIGTLNFYAFPKYMEEYYDRPLTEYDLVGREGYADGAQNLTCQDVNDFQPGDELHVVLGTTNQGWGSKRNTIFRYLTRMAADGITTYTVEKSYDAYYREEGEWIYNYSNVDTFETVIAPDPAFDQWSMLPYAENIGIGWSANYYRQKSNDPVRKTTRLDGTQVFADEDDCWTPLIDGGCPDGSSREYIKGKGGPYYDCQVSTFQRNWRELVFSSLSGVEDGTPLELILATADRNSIEAGIHPNPAADHLTIDLPAEILPVNIRLTDMRGRTVQNGIITNPSTDIDVSALHTGIYLYTLRSRSGEITNGKIAIER